MKFEAIGHILATHGLDGILIIAVKRIASDGVCSLKYLYIGSNNNPDDVLEIEAISSYKANQYQVKLKNITSSEMGDRFKGKTVFLPENQFIELQEPEETEDDLLDYKVFDGDSGEYLGIIDDVLEYPGQILLSIHREQGDFLLPYVEEFIIDIDDKKKKITVRLIEGLLDEN